MNDLNASLMISILLLIGAAGIVHAMMQLSVSVLTLLSGHSLGKKSAHTRLLRLNFSYIIGAFIAAGLIISGISLASNAVLPLLSFTEFLMIAVVLCIIGSLAIIRFYYRKGPGTLLWIPRSLAEYLTNRAKKTTNVFEAGALGAMTVVMELPFTIGLFVLVTVLMFTMSFDWRLTTTLGYSLLTVLPLLAITILLGAGHRLSTIQRWREDNKHFMQYVSSFGLLTIALFTILYFIRGNI